MAGISAGLFYRVVDVEILFVNGDMRIKVLHFTKIIWREVTVVHFIPQANTKIGLSKASMIVCRLRLIIIRAKKVLSCWESFCGSRNLKISICVELIRAGHHQLLRLNLRLQLQEEHLEVEVVLTATLSRILESFPQGRWVKFRNQIGAFFHQTYMRSHIHHWNLSEELPVPSHRSQKSLDRLQHRWRLQTHEKKLLKTQLPKTFP